MIDRDMLLDAAEDVIKEVGAAAFSIDSVAKAANVTKGGVQYAFGTKDALIDAMIDRWARKFDERVESIVGPSPSPLDLISGHIQATREITPEANGKAAGLMAAMVQQVGRRQRTREWYRKHLAGLDLSKDSARRARLSFLATEGAFLLRGFGYLTITDDEWNEIMDDTEKLLSAEKDPAR